MPCQFDVNVHVLANDSPVAKNDLPVLQLLCKESVP